MFLIEILRVSTKTLLLRYKRYIPLRALFMEPLSIAAIATLVLNKGFEEVGKNWGRKHSNRAAS